MFLHLLPLNSYYFEMLLLSSHAPFHLKQRKVPGKTTHSFYLLLVLGHTKGFWDLLRQFLHYLHKITYLYKIHGTAVLLIMIIPC